MSRSPTKRKVHRTAHDLVAAGLIPEGAHTLTDAVAQRYGIAITPAVHNLIDPTDVADPIARQFVPSGLELED